jgi:hypothetical protein
MSSILDGYYVSLAMIVSGTNTDKKAIGKCESEASISKVWDENYHV